METTWNAILWNQFGASIDMLENAIDACPDELWSDASKPPEWASHGVVGFWYLVYHTLFFLDLILAGSPEEFVPPPPFDLRELDPAGLLPDRPYTKEELSSYLRQCRQRCRQALASLTEEAFWRPRRYATMELPYAELLLYHLRHVQHHAGQLHLLLRQNVGAAPRWVRQARVAG
ncbi:MAG TPA: DinB family protein [Bryobacteraceae bacterium]|nr:DinB family protein [Bryobacteraceae bacterium]